MGSVWIFKLGVRFLMNSISKTIQSNFPWHFLKTLNRFCFKRWLPNICARQGVDEGVGLCTQHNLHRMDHMRNGKQCIADSQLTA